MTVFAAAALRPEMRLRRAASLRKRVGLRVHLRQPLCRPARTVPSPAGRADCRAQTPRARPLSCGSAGQCPCCSADVTSGTITPTATYAASASSPSSPMIMPDKQAHAGTEQQRDCRRGDRVRVEHLQQLDVRRDDRNEIALIASLKLGRAEPTQRAEHLIADAREELEGDEMVARLLRIAKSSAQHRKYEHARKQRPQSQRYRKMQQLQQCITAKDRDQRRAEYAQAGPLRWQGAYILPADGQVRRAGP